MPHSPKSTGIGPTVWIRDQVARKHDFVWPAVRGRRFRSNIINSYKILYAIIRGPIWQEQPIYETKPISHLLSMRARGVLRDRFLSTNCSRVQRRSGIDEARRKSGRHLLSSQERFEDERVHTRYWATGRRRRRPAPAPPTKPISQLGTVT